MADFLGSIGATAWQAHFAAPEHDIFLMLMSNSEITSSWSTTKRSFST